MKGREGLKNVRRLQRLLSNSGARGDGASRSISHLPSQFCLESNSSVDDSPVIPPSNFGDNFFSKKVCNRGLSSYFTALRPSSSLFSLALSPTLLVCSRPAGSVPCTPPHTLSSVDVFESSFCMSAASFATLRERLQDDKGEEEDGGQENQVAREPRRPRQLEIQTVDTEREASSDEQFNKGTTAASEIKNGSEKSVLYERENESGSVRDEVVKEVGWSELGWTRDEVLNWPNAISSARLLSGPLLAWMILHELWSPAFVGLVIAGISDWLDGYVARRMEINSVVGSYLDPVADKFLVGSVAISMAYTGLLHPALVGLIVARDGVLMVGAFVYRAYSLRWQWKDWREFFRISIGGAGKVEPLFISKVNTVFQLALVGVALLQPALSLEDTYSIVPALSWSVVVTTSMSWVAYAYIYLKNPENLAALRRAAHAPKVSPGSASKHLKP